MLPATAVSFDGADALRNHDLLVEIIDEDDELDPNGDLYVDPEVRKARGWLKRSTPQVGR